MDSSQDPVRTLIKAKLAERRLSMAEASIRLGRNRAYLQQFIERGTPVRLPEDVRAALAQLLGVDEQVLKPGAPFEGVVNFLELRPSGQLTKADPRDVIPVLGSTEGGEDGLFEFNGATVDTIPRPPFLSGVPNAYALFVAGESMAPRYMPGETVLVHPGKPVTIGSFVVVQVKPTDGGTVPLAFLKRLVRRSGRMVTFEQFNPKKTLDIPTENIISMHKVVGGGEF